MNLRLAAMLTVLSLSAVACREVEVEQPSADDKDLIGGDASHNADVPATIGISLDGHHACTASRVGPRHLLTAAHCVFNASSLEIYYPPASTITLRAADDTLTPMTVARASVHPLWASKCADTLCSASAVTAKLDAPDVAVIELEAEPKNLATAKVDREPLAPGDLVRVTGFGCTTGVYVSDNVAISLRTAEQKVVDASAAIHDGSFVTAADLPIFGGNYALTAGAAGLCPGDSGGPLYKVDAAGELRVAGVNANYTLRPDTEDDVGIPVTNWHTRLDGKSRNAVGQWLSEVGVP